MTFKSVKAGDIMRISVIGCGRWGSFIAWYLNGIGKDVRLYGRENSEHIKVLMASNRNKSQAIGCANRLLR